jgi:disulfide bond formation protein DsbB
MHNPKVETFIKIIFLVSLVSIISAYFIEYALGHQPCNLCLIERIPYGLAIVLIISNHILIKNKRFIILLLILVFSFSLIISLYHFGIEQGIFEESTVCGLKDASSIVSKEELLKQLQVKNVSCKDVTFRIFGFSLTSLNIIISLILVIFLSKTFKNYEKFKK